MRKNSFTCVLVTLNRKIQAATSTENIKIIDFVLKNKVISFFMLSLPLYTCVDFIVYISLLNIAVTRKRKIKRTIKSKTSK